MGLLLPLAFFGTLFLAGGSARRACTAEGSSSLGGRRSYAGRRDGDPYPEDVWPVYAANAVAANLDYSGFKVGPTWKYTVLVPWLNERRLSGQHPTDNVETTVHAFSDSHYIHHPADGNVTISSIEHTPAGAAIARHISDYTKTN